MQIVLKQLLLFLVIPFFVYYCTVNWICVPIKNSLGIRKYEIPDKISQYNYNNLIAAFGVGLPLFLIVIPVFLVSLPFAYLLVTYHIFKNTLLLIINCCC